MLIFDDGLIKAGLSHSTTSSSVSFSAVNRRVLRLCDAKLKKSVIVFSLYFRKDNIKKRITKRCVQQMHLQSCHFNRGKKRIKFASLP